MVKFLVASQSPKGGWVFPCLHPYQNNCRELCLSVRLPGRSRASSPVLTDFNMTSGSSPDHIHSYGLCGNMGQGINTAPDHIRTTNLLILAWPPEATGWGRTSPRCQAGSSTDCISQHGLCIMNYSGPSRRSNPESEPTVAHLRPPFLTRARMIAGWLVQGLSPLHANRSIFLSFPPLYYIFVHHSSPLWLSSYETAGGPGF